MQKEVKLEHKYHKNPTNHFDFICVNQLVIDNYSLTLANALHGAF